MNENNTGLPTPLHFPIECRTSRHVRTTVRHQITINTDWSVETPHNLEAERIAEALGAYCSCVELVDRTIPVFRDAYPLLTRRERAAIRRAKNGAWHLPASDFFLSCCSSGTYQTIRAALDHMRSPKHLANLGGASFWQLEAVMNAASRASAASRSFVTVDHETASLVRNVTGVDELWRAGIHPDDIRALAEPARATSDALPTSYFVAMAYDEVDPEWVAAVLPYRPDGETAAWLVSLRAPERTATAAEWGAWLSFGLPRDDIQGAVEGGLSSEFVVRTASNIGWPVDATARAFVSFARIDCHPAPAHFAAMRDHGIERPRPSSSAVEELVEHAKKRAFSGQPVRGGVPSRTELAVMLVILGTQHDVRLALARGTLAAADLPLHGAATRENA